MLLIAFLHQCSLAVLQNPPSEYTPQRVVRVPIDSREEVNSATGMVERRGQQPVQGDIPFRAGGIMDVFVVLLRVLLVLLEVVVRTQFGLLQHSGALLATLFAVALLLQLSLRLIIRVIRGIRVLGFHLLNS